MVKLVEQIKVIYLIIIIITKFDYHLDIIVNFEDYIIKFIIKFVNFTNLNYLSFQFVIIKAKE